jgi:lipopolysaccharide export system permease protein
MLSRASENAGLICHHHPEISWLYFCCFATETHTAVWVKKIDKLVLSSFLGPFVLTYAVVNFILLTVKMLQYFDDLIGKDLGWDVLGTFVFYLTVVLTPGALPLAVLLASLIAYGNLGEHFELTAIKSLGISLVRSLRPIFIFVLFLTVAAFFINNYLVPRAALEAYSLLYDIKQKKPALDLREGTFFNGIPEISIKVNKKYPDGITLKDVIIYDHRNRSGNKEVIIADSGKMFSFMNDQYLKMELFRGYNYSEGNNGADLSGASQPSRGEGFSKTAFGRSEFVFDLSSFDLKRTEKQLFQGNRIMRNMGELQTDMDSIEEDRKINLLGIFKTKEQLFSYHLKRDSIALPPDLVAAQQRKDSIARARAAASHSYGGYNPTSSPSYIPSVSVSSFIRHLPDSSSAFHQRKSDSLLSIPLRPADVTAALSHARSVKAQLLTFNTNIQMEEAGTREFRVQWHKILANSFACLAMFLIGAPLGAIIKKGGLGVPVLISIFFFILFYVMGIMGDKWAKNDIVPVIAGVWGGNVVLFALGMVFLRQARVDARLFDADFYSVIWDRFKNRFQKPSEATAPVKGT